MRKILTIAALMGATTLAPGLHNLKFLTKKELKCLADNVYYEARGESYEGMLAVARVTINRTQHPDYPDSICGVVYQPFQFSWTMKKQKPVGVDYEIAKWAALNASNYKLNAIFYHNLKVKPSWSKAKTKTAKIGNHVFYI